MSVYFDKFPTIRYDNENIRDITKRTKFIESNLSDPLLFLPYTIREGEKPEDVAFNYYGTVDYTWLVLLANNMLDPYYDWPLDEQEFNEYLIKKYSEQSGLKGYDVVAWTQNETIADNIVYYYKFVEEEEIIYTGESPATSNTAPVEDFDNTTVTINGIQYVLNRV
jgi:hypothetical protein